MGEPTHIEVRGARVHNLQNVDVSLPRDSLVVITGVSGSGKSSLAFDTVYKEGQRRFMESLSSYARQFLGQMERPAVDSVDGISPTLCIDQKTVNRNPRSTVGTITELYDHLRLLMARLGTPHCPRCGTEVARVSVDQVVEGILADHAESRAQILAPVVRDRKGQYRKELEALARDGWARVRVDGELRRLDEEFELARYEKHTIEVVVDRVKVVRADRGRLSEAVEVAAGLSGGVVVVLVGETELVFSTERGCPHHPEISIPELEPRLFSFNAPQGACAECNGLGVLEEFRTDLVVDLDARAKDCFRAFNDEGRLPFSHFDRSALAKVVKKIGGPAQKALEAWPPDRLDVLLEGDPGLTYTVAIDRGDGRREVRERQWRGLMGMVREVWKWTGYSRLEGFRVRTTCGSCAGSRLNPIARSVTFRDHSIDQLSVLTVEAASAFFSGLRLRKAERDVGVALVAEIRDRLDFLVDVGLGYIGLDRSAATLSGGEAQRIRLAAQVGSALQGVTYVLDEPSIGLHPRDNARLLKTLYRLRDRGNSVLVVEHDLDTILAADHVVDVGPGAGALGGHVVASTTPARLGRSRGLTGQYMRGELSIPVPARRREPAGWLTVRGAHANNLNDLDVRFPLGVLTVVTGVSGSGKSTLVFQVLERTASAEIQRSQAPDSCRGVDGLDQIDKVIRISQQPIGRTPRSNPATYTGAFDHIRAMFAATPEARARGYKKGRFSFNVAGGRCESCEGAGVRTVEMQFLPSVEVPCEVCGGRRFNRETLDITWKGRTIADVLDLTVAQAADLFQPVPKIRRVLSTMVEVGLGYVPLGQPSTTLSGGEAQRVKLATELHRPATGRTLYFLDEPTTGLHIHDVKALLAALMRLVDAGNTVIIVEHHADVVKCADHLIDLGPEGGTGGGDVVGEGSPEHVATLSTPTGHALARLPELSAVSLAAEPPMRSRRRRRAGPNELVVVGARKHNLRDVEVHIPHGTLTVITGVSGSGKTSLAFDTLFAEGQRRYVESLSTYARRFLGRLDRAPVDRLEGLRPAIAIDQRNASHNPRSTVATVTEIHDVLRLLWARIGKPHCPTCDREIRGYSPSAVAAALKESGQGAGWLVCDLEPASMAEERRRALVRDGWARLLIDGREVDLEAADAAVALADGAALVIDRVNAGRTAASRLAEGAAQAYALGHGRLAFVERSGSTSVFTERPACPDHGVVFTEALTPRHFSFNSRLGACVRCDGLGVARRIVPDKLFPRPAMGFWDAMDARVASVLSRSPRNRTLIGAVLGILGLDDRSPVGGWSDEQWAVVLEGLDEPVQVSWSQSWGRTQRTVEEERKWAGVIAVLEGWSSSLDWLTDVAECPACRGGRLQRPLLRVRVGRLGIHELSRLSVDDAAARIAQWALDGADATIAERAVDELVRRLAFLQDVGLGYLGLDRAAETLSGGEAQRIRLASQLGSSLTGVVYVLDEPTVGLHPRDTDRLLRTLEGLRDHGNTVIVVEHDPDTIRRADYVIDLGPGAGRHGGQVVASGTPVELAANPASVTGRWLSGAASIPRRSKYRKPKAWMTLREPRANNLRCGDVRFPLGLWTAVSGVSGSGKSSLVMDTLAPALQCKVGRDVATAPHAGLDLDKRVDRVVVVDQSPIGRNPRSTPATYTKVLDKLRALYAQTPAARARGWKPGRFSFNAAGGRCPVCEGRGAILVEMHFLPDVWVTCEGCAGKRFGKETLEVRWKGHTIADVLAMRADEALDLFVHHKAVHRSLEALVDVGLGYLSLGQAANTLSGGEAQRVKLAAELTSRRGHCVYILDEPTTGLHMADVAKLVEVLHRLVDRGHTVITIEHHLDILLQADHLVDMGPEGGAGGGSVVATGSALQVAEAGTATGVVLATRL